MKKAIVIFLAVVCLSTYTQAQVTFGVKAGLNLADQNGKSEGESFGSDSKIKVGFHVGGTADISLGENLFFQTGLLFSTKGSKAESEESDGGITIKATQTTSFNYLEIPLNVGYKFGDFHVYVGPYVAYALSGKVKSKLEISGLGSEESEEDIEFGDESGITRGDFGVNLGLGYQFSNFVISAQYGLGLANLVKEGDSDNSFKNSVIGISVGYKFGKAE